MVINAALSEGAKRLRAVSDVPLLESRILMEKATGLDRLGLIKKGVDELECDEEKRYFLLLGDRLTGRPIAYIIGHKEFMGLDFFVDENVLIPRPDTETLVQAALDSGKKRILDIGTGSGAIAVSLARLDPLAEVSAVDISQNALAVAEKNAKENGVSVSFSRLDILNEEISGTFDMIVSNPPYISDFVIPTLDETVKNFEPRLALSGGEDGLIFYREITKKALRALEPGGLLMFEIGFDQGEAVSEIMAGDYKNIKIIKDLAGATESSPAKKNKRLGLLFSFCRKIADLKLIVSAF